MVEASRHIVMRLAPEVFAEGRTVDVIKEHNSMAQEHGFVAVGKFGAAPKGAIAAIEKLLEQGHPADLYLVHKEGDEFRGFRAPLRWVGLKRPPERYRACHPAYYGESGRDPTAWFVVDAPFVLAELKDLKLASSGRDLVTVMSECRTATMLVEGSTKAEGRTSD
ncbi:MAG: hypothetical protein KJO57_05565 [Deltaproteobacteria bacterium]|nr:hypothetical protein [Deltaproteobacteria bacterium]